MVATFRKPVPQADPIPKYLAPHSGVRESSSLLSPELEALLADPDLGFVVATDHGRGYESSSDRGIVYKKSTHELMATMYVDSGIVKVRDLLVSDADLMPDAGAGVAMSAKRNEVAFFDAASYYNLSNLAIRRVSLDLGYSERAELRFSTAGLAGPVVSAAYRDADDSYYILSRGGGKIALHRVDIAANATLVSEWADSGAWTSIAITASDEGGLALSKRGSQGFGVFVVDVSAGGGLERVAVVGAAEPLADAPVLSAEGLMFDRAGLPSDEVVPLAPVAGTEPWVTYGATNETEYTSFFQ